MTLLLVIHLFFNTLKQTIKFRFKRNLIVCLLTVLADFFYFDSFRFIPLTLETRTLFI